MSLDVYLTIRKPVAVHNGNITHNLGAMAKESGIYQHLWRPEEIGITTAAQLIEPLRLGLGLLMSDPDRFRKHDATNGWGRYEHLVCFVGDYLAACEAHPDASVTVSR
jgi:hypothetical protein